MSKIGGDAVRGISLQRDLYVSGAVCLRSYRSGRAESPFVYIKSWFNLPQISAISSRFPTPIATPSRHLGVENVEPKVVGLRGSDLPIASCWVLGGADAAHDPRRPKFGARAAPGRSGGIAQKALIAAMLPRVVVSVDVDPRQCFAGRSGCGPAALTSSRFRRRHRMPSSCGREACRPLYQFGGNGSGSVRSRSGYATRLQAIHIGWARLSFEHQAQISTFQPPDPPFLLAVQMQRLRQSCNRLITARACRSASASQDRSGGEMPLPGRNLDRDWPCADADGPTLQ